MQKIISSLIMLGMLSTPALATKTQLTFWTSSHKTLFPATEQACDAFNESQDKYAVSCIAQGSYRDIVTKAIAAYRAKNHPEMILFYDAGTADMLMSGAVIPAYQVATDADWASYSNGSKSYYQDSNDNLWGQPYNGSTFLFYGNKTKLASVGETKLPETWEQLVRIGKKLKTNGEQCIFSTDLHPWRVIEQFGARHNTALATNNNGYGGLDAEYKITGGLIEKHLTNLLEWRKQGLVSVNKDLKQNHYGKAFDAGDCAMIEASTGGYRKAFDALGDNLMVGLAPMYEGYKRHNQFIGGGAIWVMKGHADKAEGIKAFLDFIRKPEWQILVTEATGYMPMTNDVVVELQKTGATEKPEFGAVEMGLTALNAPTGENSRGIRLGFYPQFRDVFKVEIAKAVDGKKTVAEALRHTQSEGNKLLRRFEKVHKGKKLP